MGDVATWYLALGAATLLAVRRASWRVPVLALALIQYALHSLNHLIDIGGADPCWIGPADFASLLLTALLLGGCFARERGGAMRVFLAGASGAIGRPLLPKLIAAGHEVTGMTRSEERAKKVRATGAAPRWWTCSTPTH